MAPSPVMTNTDKKHGSVWGQGFIDVMLNPKQVQTMCLATPIIL